MKLWNALFEAIKQLRGACSRKRTFLWMSAVIMAMCSRCGDIYGVTSFVRILGLKSYCYDRILDFFHSPSLNINLLTGLWSKLILKLFSAHVLKINERFVLVADGIKIAKEGKKMPAVKSLHQESESNTKPEYIMGHSCQAVAILAHADKGFFAIPLLSQIHEGLVFSNRCRRTLYDKLLKSLNLLELHNSYYLVVDAYYAVAKMAEGLINNGNHLITRVKKNAVAYMPASTEPGKQKRGRPKKYGKKIKLNSLFKNKEKFVSDTISLYGEHKTPIRYYSIDLFWRPAGILVKFVAVIHPIRGSILLMSTDINLSAVDIIKIYALRFKIEVSFKQAVHTIGTYAYHFWMKSMDPIKRRSGKQYLHRKTEKYRDNVKRKMDAYHRHIQLGLISQGLLQYLSCTMPNTVWNKFGSWLRTIRPDIAPSERVVAMALRNTLPEFLVNNSGEDNFKKFIIEKIDISRAEGMRLVA